MDDHYLCEGSGSQEEIFCVFASPSYPPAACLCNSTQSIVLSVFYYLPHTKVV